MYALGQPSPSPHSSPMEKTLFIFWLWESSIPKATYRNSIKEIKRIGLEAKAVLPQIVEDIEYAWGQNSSSGYVGHLIQIVGNLGPKAAPAIPVLVQTLGDRKPGSYARQEVLETLGKIGPQAPVRPLSVAQSGNLLARTGP